MSRLLHDIGGGNERNDSRQYGDAKFGEGGRGQQSLSRMEIRRRSLPDLQDKFGQRREGNGWQDHEVKGRNTVSEAERAARRIPSRWNTRCRGSMHAMITVRSSATILSPLSHWRSEICTLDIRPCIQAQIWSVVRCSHITSPHLP
jgi:hypothetical protein